MSKYRLVPGRGGASIRCATRSPTPRTAARAADRFGSLLALGAAAILGTHVVINIGMNIRLTPVTGVPLPLLSYGGSSVLCSLIAAGLLQNIHIHRRS